METVANPKTVAAGSLLGRLMHRQLIDLGINIVEPDQRTTIDEECEGRGFTPSARQVLGNLLIIRLVVLVP